MYTMKEVGTIVAFIIDNQSLWNTITYSPQVS
jgi:hypothetical protein